MIAGIGVDIVEIDRVQKAMSKHESFVSRIFTDKEQEYCLSFSNSAERFAGRFAAKEAIAKALGSSLSWLDVEILPDDAGKPIVMLSGQAAEVAGGRALMVTISHCRDYAVAYALAQTSEC